MSEPVLTFSGTHPFRRQHVMAGGSRVQELVADEVCPRCEGPLYPPDREALATLARRGDPHPIWRPAGSRVTACRCIPVCDLCGDAESFGTVAQQLLVGGITSEDGEALGAEYTAGLEYVWHTASAPPRNWPVDRERMTLGLAVIRASGAIRGYGLDDELPANLKPSPHPGGWADPDN